MATASPSVAQSAVTPVRSSSVVTLLRLEGLVVAAISAVLYARTGASWWLFAALWLLPDLSMLGYLTGRPCWGRAHLQRVSHLRCARCAGARSVAAARARVDAYCAHLVQPHRRGPFSWIWTEVCGGIWLHAPRPPWWKKANRYYGAVAGLSRLLRGNEANTTRERPKPISAALITER